MSTETNSILTERKPGEWYYEGGSWHEHVEEINVLDRIVEAMTEGDDD